MKNTRTRMQRKGSTDQEMFVQGLFREEGIPFEHQVVLPIGRRVLAVDFLIDLRYWGVVPPVVLECSITSLKRRRGIGVLTRKAQHLDYKFKAIKRFHNHLCVALLEINDMTVDPQYLRRKLSDVFFDCDLLLCDSFNLVPDLKKFLPVIYSSRES